MKAFPFLTEGATIAAEAFGSFRNSAAADFGRLRLDIPELPLEIVGDREELRLAIEMLLDNARKYSGAGGAVSLRSSNSGDRTEVEVRDDGPGIPPDELPKVLERFYRASNVKGKLPGSGLGLAIVKSIVQKHGGTITLLNLEPKGLSVVLSFPPA